MACGTIAVFDRGEESNRCRKFTLADGMILVAGSALALASGRLFFSDPIVHLIEWLPRLCGNAAAHRSDLFEHLPVFFANIRFPLIHTLWFSCRLVQLSLLGFTPTFFVLRLRRPRPVLRELLRQPGTMAGLAIVFGWVGVSGYLDYFLFFKSHGYLRVPTGIGGTVAIVWVTLVLSRRWQREPGWIDPIGRSLGYAAIVLTGVIPWIYRF